mgnify:FL=1|jgi:hypothetical protein
MVNVRKLTISCKYFWGFTRDIDLDTVNSCHEMTNFIIHECRNWLTENNMLALVDILNNIVKTKGYHIHGPDNITEREFFNTILLTDSQETIYICSH